MATKRLILLRHAKSDWHSGASSDFDRPLNQRGARDAPRMGQWLAEQGYLPDMIVSSPAERTIQTVELSCATLGVDADIVEYDRQLYHGGVHEIQEIADRYFQVVDTVMIVAHNPGMEMAVLSFCPRAPRFPDGKLMPTCTAAVIEFGSAHAVFNGGELLALQRPGNL